MEVAGTLRNRDPSGLITYTEPGCEFSAVVAVANAMWVPVGGDERSVTTRDSLVNLVMNRGSRYVVQSSSSEKSVVYFRFESGFWSSSRRFPSWNQSGRI